MLELTCWNQHFQFTTSNPIIVLLSPNRLFAVLHKPTSRPPNWLLCYSKCATIIPASSFRLWLWYAQISLTVYAQLCISKDHRHRGPYPCARQLSLIAAKLMTTIANIIPPPSHMRSGRGSGWLLVLFPNWAMVIDIEPTFGRSYMSHTYPYDEIFLCNTPQIQFQFLRSIKHKWQLAVH